MTDSAGNSGFLNIVFVSEARLVYDRRPPEDLVARVEELPEGEKQAAVDKALTFLGALNDLEHLEGGEDPKSILQDNPFADHLLSFVKSFEDEDMNFDVKEHKPGKLVLKYAAAHDLIIEKELYVAIFWKGLKEKMDGLFAGKGISDELIYKAATESSGFQSFLFYLATAPSPVDPKKVEAVLKDLNALRPSLAPTAAAARDATRGRVEGGEVAERRGKRDREEFREHEGLPKPKVTLPTTPKWDKDRFVTKVKDPNWNVEFDRWKVNISRQATKINVTHWDPSKLDGANASSLGGLELIYQNFKDLGIMDQNPEFYQTMFAILRNAADPKTNPYLGESDRYRVMFQSPAQHRDELRTLEPKGGFWGGEQFVYAHDQLEKIKTIILSQDAYQVKLAEHQRKLKEDPLATGAVDFIKSNLTAMQTALREKDWATAGVYAVGIYALYKAYGKLTEGAGGDKFKKWLIYGTAAYAGHIFAKNAGYDLFKILGIKDADYEVKGTPMEIMKGILSDHPHLHDKTKDIDYGIVLQMGDVNLKELHKLYKDSNKQGIEFIHPKELRNAFPDLAQVWPFKTGLGVDIKDYLGMSGKKLSTKEKEYVRVGQQIWKIAFSMQGMYDETLRKGAPDNSSPDKRHSAYEGKTYEEALNNSKLLGNSHLWHFIEAIKPYANTDVTDNSILAMIRDKHKVEDMLTEAFADVPESGVYVEEAIGEGHYPGRINNFPVVFVRSNEGWKVYLRHQYGKGYVKNPGPSYVSVIPFQGPDRTFRAKQAIDAVKRRMIDLIKPLVAVTGRDLLSRTLAYDQGKWRCKVQFAALAEYDLTSSEQEAVIEPNYDGNAVTLMDAAGMGKNFKIRVSEDIMKQNPLNPVILSSLTNQKEFHVFRILNGVDALKIKDNVAGDSKFVLDIGGRLQVNIKYDKASKKFLLDPATQEAELLKPGSGFAQEIYEALHKNEDLDKIFKQWRKLIEETPESYFVNFFKQVPDWFRNMTLTQPVRGVRIEHFTGSVPKNYTLALLDAQKEFVVSKIFNSMYGVSTLNEVSDKIDTILPSALTSFKTQMENFSKLNTRNYKEGQDFSAEAFKDNVFAGIAETGVKSKEARRWHRGFVDEIFTRHGFDDLREGNSFKARDIVKVFAYYTSAVDDPSIDDVDLHATITEEEQKRYAIIGKVEDELGTPLLPTDEQFDNAGVPGIETRIGRPLSVDEAAAVADLSDIVELRKTIKEYEKLLKFDLYADYVDYVVGQMYLKINGGDLKSKAKVPGPGSFWDIDPFYIWKNRPRTSTYKFVDREPPLRKKSDYKPFDEYLKLSNTEKDKLLARMDAGEVVVVAPRRSTKIRMPKPLAHPRDLEIMKKVLGLEPGERFDVLEDEVDKSGKVTKKGRTPFEKTTKMPKTDVEQMYFDAVQEALDGLQKKYNERPGKIATLRDHLSLNFHLDEVLDASGKFNGEYDYKYTDTNLARRVRHTEAEFARMRRVSKTQQEIMVKDQVKDLVNEVVFKDFDTYFNEPGLMTKLVEEIKNFWAWLW